MHIVTGGGNSAPYTTTCSTNNNYANSFVYNDYLMGTDQTEYIQTQLSATMQTGKTYVISFYIHRGIHSNGYLSGVGIWLTNQQLYVSNQNAIQITPSAISTNTVLINGSSWNKISFCYYASGTENFLTIGRPSGYNVSFVSAPSSTCSQYINLNGISRYYMEIDNVNVVPFNVTASATSYSVDVCGSVSLNGTLSCGNAGLSSLIYSWSGNGLSNTAIPNPVATIHSSSAYNLSVYGTDSQGNQCSTSDGFVVMSNTVNPLILTASANTICPGANFTITPSLAGGTGSYTFIPGNFVGSTFASGTWNAITYTVSGTGANGCVQTKTITINVFNDVLNASASPTAICVGSTSTVSATGSISGYTWSPGNFTNNPQIVQPGVKQTTP